MTSIVVVPPSASNAASRALCYCWTASLDGTIRYWDFSVPELMKTVDVKLPIFSMVWWSWFCLIVTDICLSYCIFSNVEWYRVCEELLFLRV